MHAVVSVDGFIADLEENVGPLFDWYFNGDAEIVDGGPFKVSSDSVRYVRPMWQGIGTIVMGRQLFDLTNGWEGTPPAGEHIVVVTHRPRPEGWHPEASCQFVDNISRAIMVAKELAGERDVAVTAGNVGGQASHSGSSTRSRWTSCPWCSGAASGTSGPSTRSSYWRIQTS